MGIQKNELQSVHMILMVLDRVIILEEIQPKGRRGRLVRVKKLKNGKEGGELVIDRNDRVTRETLQRVLRL